MSGVFISCPDVRLVVVSGSEPDEPESVKRFGWEWKIRGVYLFWHCPCYIALNPMVWGGGTGPQVLQGFDSGSWEAVLSGNGDKEIDDDGQYFGIL
jgi:hypothetical protein